MTKIALFPSDCMCVVNDELWFFHGCLNALVKYNIKTNETEIVGEVKDKAFCSQLLYNKIFYINKKIYLIPFSANNIAIYDIAKNEFEYFYIESYKSGYLYKEAFEDGNNIYCIPRLGTDHIMLFNTEKNEIEDRIPFPNGQDIEYSTMNVGNICREGEKVLIPLYSHTSKKNVCIWFDIFSQNFEILKFNIDARGFRSAQVVDNKIYLEATDFAMYEVCMNDYSKINMIKQFNEEFKIIGKQGKKLLIDFTSYYQKLYWYNIETGELKLRDNVIEEINKGVIDLGYFYGVYQKANEGSMYWYFNRCNNKLYYVDEATKVTKKFELQLSKIKQIELYNKIIRNEDVDMLEEGKGWNLNMFIDGLFVDKKREL